MKKKVSPNRMNLFRLRKRLVLAQRGHKLLKDKLEGLVRELQDLIGRYQGLRERFDAMFARVLARFTLAAAVGPEGAVAEAVRQNAAAADLRVSRRKLMGVAVPALKPPPPPQHIGYSLTQTPPELDVAFEQLRELSALLFELAEIEHGILQICRDLERTRRRTNALEYVLIPELQEERRDVEQKIAEYERANTSRLMKIKDMLMAER
jgi:V/A-type H+-transporting ATPase subunit D